MSSAAYSVVVPVYRNAPSLPEVVSRLEELAASLQRSLEAVFVVDGSPDNSVAVSEQELRSGRVAAKVVVLSRNFGSFSAIRVGLAHSEGEYIAVMAADLQEPIDVVRAFFEVLEADQCDIAIGQREARDDPAVSGMTSGLYWKLYRRFVNPDLPAGGVDIFGCTREVAQHLISFSERNTSLVGLLFWLGYRRQSVPYTRVARPHGKSAWTTRRKVRYLLDSVYAFTDLPILLLQAIGAIGLIASVLFGVVVLVAYAAGQITQPGYTPLIITMLASTSAILIGLGVVGSYVWRAFENGQSRPVAIVSRVEVFASRPTAGEPSQAEVPSS